MLGLGVKQGLTPMTNNQIIVSTPQNNQSIKVTNTAPVQVSPSVVTGEATSYAP